MQLYLRAWRDHLGLTLEQAGNRIGVHLSTLQKWEKNVNHVSPEDIEKIAVAYGVHPIALFFSPNDQARATMISRAMDVITKANPESAEKWLAMGELIAVSPKD